MIFFGKVIKNQGVNQVSFEQSTVNFQPAQNGL
jgi:hypothetical protein